MKLSLLAWLSPGFYFFTLIIFTQTLQTAAAANQQVLTSVQKEKNHKPIKNSGPFAENLQNETRERDEKECREVKDVNATEKCIFIQNTTNCQDDDGFINYKEFIFCDFEYRLVTLAVLILVFWWLMLFVALAVTADTFFCPSLVVIAKTMRMSENIAGVTLLAFGNGAPDVFSAIAAVGSMKNGDAGLAIGALFGAGIFVSTVVAGAITVTKPFKAMQRPLLRDIIFFIGAVFFVFCILYKHEVTLPETIGFLGLYSSYVLVVVVGRYVYQKRKNQAQTTGTGSQDNLHQDSLIPNSQIEDSDDDLLITNEHVPSPACDDELLIADGQIQHTGAAVTAEQLGEAPAFAKDILNDIDSHSITEDTDNDDKAQLLAIKGRKSHLREFLCAISPIDPHSWAQSGILSKCLQVFKAPVVFILVLAIPVVDTEIVREKWNKPLRLINILIGPTIAIFGAKSTFALTYIRGVFPVWAVVLIVSLLLAILVYFTSTTQRQPLYHPVFAFVGFVISVIWIACIAKEIVSLLQALGVVMDLSDAILGLTFLAWGNSIGDMVANISVAKKGIPRAAISACFGGPLFNILVGLGIPFTIEIVSEGSSLPLKFTLIQVVLVTTLFLSLVTTLIVIPLLKFNFKRGYGIYLFIFYVMFLIVAILTETGVIKASL